MAGRKGFDDGKLEWILPARTSELRLEMDPSVPKDPFVHEGSNDLELCADLLAKRLSSLLNKSNAQIYDSEAKSWIDVTEPDSNLRPQDIMILVASRKRIPLLIQALENHGIPAMADKQGLLLNRPVIKPLMSLLQLLVNPNNRVAALGVARSVIFGLNDEEISKFIGNKDENQLDLLIENSPNEKVKSLFERIRYLQENGMLREAIDATIDYSDLLYYFSKEGDRQDVENWVNLYDKLAKSSGNDSAITLNRLNSLLELGKDG